MGRERAEDNVGLRIKGKRLPLASSEVSWRMDHLFLENTVCST